MRKEGQCLVSLGALKYINRRLFSYEASMLECRDSVVFSGDSRGVPRGCGI